MSVLSQAQTATKACHWFIFSFLCLPASFRFASALLHSAMYCCPKGGAFLRSIALKGWKSTKKLPSLAVPLNSDHQCFCMRCMSLCALSTVWKVPIGKHASRCNWNALYAVLTFSSLMQNSTAKRFFHLSDNSSPELVLSCRHYGCWYSWSLNHFR